VRCFVILPHVVPPQTTHFEEAIPRVSTKPGPVTLPGIEPAAAHRGIAFTNPAPGDPALAPSLPGWQPDGEQRPSVVSRRPRAGSIARVLARCLSAVPKCPSQRLSL
jgi:hypothetical protein